MFGLLGRFLRFRVSRVWGIACSCGIYGFRVLDRLAWDVGLKHLDITLVWVGGRRGLGWTIQGFQISDGSFS